MAETRSVDWYDSLAPGDFHNGAVLDEIRDVFKERDRLLARVSELEYDGEGGE